jgi:hypothetical protein
MVQAGRLYGGARSNVRVFSTQVPQVRVRHVLKRTTDKNKKAGRGMSPFLYATN